MKPKYFRLRVQSDQQSNGSIEAVIESILRNLKSAIFQNGFDEFFFLAWNHLYYGIEMPKSAVPTLFYFVRVKGVFQSHVRNQ